ATVMSPAPNRFAMHKRTHLAPEREREGPAAPCPRGNREPRSKATEGTLSEMRMDPKWHRSSVDRRICLDAPRSAGRETPHAVAPSKQRGQSCRSRNAGIGTA